MNRLKPQWASNLMIIMLITHIQMSHWKKSINIFLGHTYIRIAFKVIFSLFFIHIVQNMASTIQCTNSALLNIKLWCSPGAGCSKGWSLQPKYSETFKILSMVLKNRHLYISGNPFRSLPKNSNEKWVLFDSHKNTDEKIIGNFNCLATTKFIAA